MSRIKALIIKSLRGSLDTNEQQELEHWLAEDQKHRELFTELNNVEQVVASLRKLDQFDGQTVWNRIQAGLLSKQHVDSGEISHVVPLFKRPWLRYAAAIVILAVGGAAYLLTDPGQPKQIVRKQEELFKHDIMAGTNGAILTLSDGSTVILDSVANGVITKDGNSKLIKKDDGQLAYQANGVGKVILYNTLSTDRGRQFQVTLPDGTKVWLNASSSLRYPTFFSGSRRVVELTGEGYFEVMHNTAMPFVVKKGHAVITVIGTHFNVNAYDDEASMKVTLLEGSVKVAETTTHAEQIIKPGQQLEITENHQLNVINDINLEEVVAWKNGLFMFNGATTETIMRQVQRWYDAEIIYEGNVKQERFAGSIRRSENASKLLEVLELTKTLKFDIRGKKIIVRPYK